MNRRHCLAAALAVATSAAVATASTAPPKSTFADAAKLLRAGRHAAAYGRLVDLADAGDRDAARVALFMHRYAMPIYGTDWDATNEQLEDWMHLARLGEEADLAARRRFDRPGATSSPAGAAATPLRLDTFVPHRARR